VSEFKAYAKIDTASDDALIEDIIKAVKIKGESWTSLTFFNRTYVAFYEQHARQLDLPYGPHTAITLVERYNSDGTFTTLVNDSDYFVTGQGFRTLTFMSWGYGLRVTFSAGYGASAGNLPQDLKLATLKACLSAYEDRQDLVAGSFVEIKGSSKAYFAPKRRVIL
jgi:uncharacterized phiE125 gp8 family phage protein